MRNFEVFFAEHHGAFKQLMCVPSEITNESMGQPERFVVLMYDRTTEATEVNYARRQLFTQKSQTLENIPPTQTALKQHTKRTCYQYRPTAGSKHWFWIQRYQSHLTGAGHMKRLDHSRFGLRSLKHRHLALN